ncbi:hypothetical protein SAMN02799630_03170 [Paenibacillus sp. UNCCL117]|nr:hypothetical protein SAMN04488602_11514 [Paenibacillus sp. cl123]SFW44170.1 hypothetical protein SAMN02799630_03170 [Paenibacillus sp. UNCCL117]
MAQIALVRSLYLILYSESLHDWGKDAKKDRAFICSGKSNSKKTETFRSESERSLYLMGRLPLYRFYLPAPDELLRSDGLIGLQTDRRNPYEAGLQIVQQMLNARGGVFLSGVH